jgi:hypothetical protein
LLKKSIYPKNVYRIAPISIKENESVNEEVYRRKLSNLTTLALVTRPLLQPITSTWSGTKKWKTRKEW